MKLSDFLQLEMLVAERNHLIELKEAGAIEISISGHRQKRDFVLQDIIPFA